MKRFLILFLLVASLLSPNPISDGYTILMQAVRWNASLSLIQYLIDKGCDPLAKTKYGKTCFTIACEHSRTLDVVSYFYSLSPNPEIKTRMNETPLIYACLNPNINREIIQFLIDKGFAVNAQPEITQTEHSQFESSYILSDDSIPEGWTPLMFANRNPNGWETIKFLIEKGADINKTDGLGDTILHHICSQEIVEEKLNYLLEKGANPNQINHIGRTPLNDLIEQNKQKITIAQIKILEKFGLDFRHKTKEGYSYFKDYCKYKKAIPEKHNREVEIYLLKKIREAHK